MAAIKSKETTVEILSNFIREFRVLISDQRNRAELILSRFISYCRVFTRCHGGSVTDGAVYHHYHHNHSILRSNQLT